MWIIDTTRLYVQDLPESGKQIVPRLQPLDGPTIHQIFGYESPIFKISAVVVGSGAIGQLRAKARDKNTHTLSGAWGYYKRGIVSGFDFKPRKSVIWQSVDTNLPCDSPVYDVELEFLQDE